ncbi:FxsA family protein [Kibdelosporangium phytohabitans]|uniref:Exlusion protein FxsA n=1 Tax=Kibdelosporangium phytohabitans TaxID=860235 RepID=A0A0N9I8Z6_9PSEU|nr:FxsA family protein [Kibdelosporangium phytohabitans]ALG11124.1 hypothetical protein AOZ06_33365 [Kibdelosporangium phytohabitans]MBE1462372.1 UPF0716 protein FxsA [Kibdelosporangium phytohabitans]
MPVLILLLLAMAVEITVLVLIGSAIGVLPTILLVVVATVLGVVLLRREGTRALTAFQSKVRSGQQPQGEMLDGVLIAAAGILVVLPGFVSDVLAIALLFPPTRALVRKRVLKRAEARARRYREDGPNQVFVIDAQP